ncbi:MAG: DUF1805 domain-containing protein [Methanocalculus sp. MSAO_Arc1]|uniref:YunC family protein n=1 Tax=Methanocalculus TaxID=71151 RepID=UPI000FF71C50|nr:MULTISPECIES: DUF1805 domain-containing protein [unclassified Methanocalculus]MCP1661607.1 uncharacterized protein YunC (DUF1805 family) [Methanocalculus sp. AMF5]RQD81312.1 MAG: DUF1805 domain-containing protein [Methanocalculus sp. MSAO_Arc1]
MEHQVIPLTTSTATGYATKVGPVTLVFIKTESGMIGCGAFDITALERFGVPAATMKSSVKPMVESIEDLLLASVHTVNHPGYERGIRIGMQAREALELLG